MSDVTLSKAVRSNLLSLQNTANMMSQTQNRLATGNKVNSALDNPTNFFTASSLNSRAGDINQLMDGMANGIQTIEAADNGLTAITKTLESMSSTLRQARQDKSFQTASYTIDPSSFSTAGTISLSGGAIGSTPKTVAVPAATDATATTLNGSQDVAATYTGGTLTINGEDVTIADDADADAIITAIGSTVEGLTVTNDAGTLQFSLASGEDLEIGGSAALLQNLGLGNGTQTSNTSTNGKVGTVDVDAVVSAINGDDELAGKVRASNDNGKLRIENLSTQALTVGGATSSGKIDGTSSTTSIDGNSVRADMATQFRELRDQLDKLADDASFNGINLLRGDNLKITFNETGTSELDIRSKDDQGISSTVLDLTTNLQPEDLDSDENIDKLLGDVKSAINNVRSQASAFGSSLSIVQNRQDFSKNMINTLQTGASNLTLADANEEAANLLALQTRQQLSSTALSMASQADQAVLRLF